jgi:hypothetical protein
LFLLEIPVKMLVGTATSQSFGKAYLLLVGSLPCWLQAPTISAALFMAITAATYLMHGVAAAIKRRQRRNAAA